jgi:hypothetical protein
LCAPLLHPDPPSERDPLSFNSTTSSTIHLSFNHLHNTSKTALMSLGITPIVQVTMADAPSPTSGSLVDKVAALDIKHDGKVSASPTSTTPTLANPVTQGGSPFAGLAGVKDDGTNIGSAAARKASVHERERMSFTTGSERKGSQIGSRRPSRRGSGIITTPSGQQQVFHTRTNVSALILIRGS